MPLDENASYKRLPLALKVSRVFGLRSARRK